MNKKDRAGICLLNWNGIKYTASCLLSLFEQDYNNIQIYILDQGSTDGSLEKLRLLAENNEIVKLYEAGKNIGFSSGNNRLMEMALDDGCEYILIFNNDTKAFPDMISTMVKCFEDNPDCGACGVAAFDYKTGDRLWGIGGFIRRDDAFLHIDGFGKYWTDNHLRICPRCNAKLPLNYREPSNVKCLNCKLWPYDIPYIPCDYIGGGCLMTTKDVINKIGVFDINYNPIYEEDLDLCCRIREGGYKVIHINKSGFYHAVSAFTNKEQSKFWDTHQKNKKYFIEKWGKKIDANLV